MVLPDERSVLKDILLIYGLNKFYSGAEVAFVSFWRWLLPIN